MWAGLPASLIPARMSLTGTADWRIRSEESMRRLIKFHQTLAVPTQQKRLNRGLFPKGTLRRVAKVGI
jgi:hypothetical protein